jgi:NHL repeat
MLMGTTTGFRRREGVVLAILVASWASVLMLCAGSASAFEYRHLGQFGAPGVDAGQFTQPGGVAIDQSTHSVYVADTGNSRVEKFDAAGQFIAAWGWAVADGNPQSEICTIACQAGLAGTGQGQFDRPLEIAVDNSAGPSRGDVYVADEAGAVVEKFTSEGFYLSSIVGGARGPFSTLLGVAVDEGGNVWVYDSVGEVYEFDQSGSLVREWNTGYGTSRGFAVDTNGDVYVVRGCGCTEKFSLTGQDFGELDPSSETATDLAAEPGANVLFNDQGTFVAKYDTGANLPTTSLTKFGEGVLQAATGLGIDVNTGDVYVADSATDRIQIFGPPQPGSPQIEHVSAVSVATTSARLTASIYTGQFDTTFHFEYGPSAAYGRESPVIPADIGAGLENVNIARGLSGLTPNTVYHYRVVAENQQGIVVGGDQTFTTFASPESSQLPDGRVYELVSPPDKNGGDIGFLGRVDTQAATSGNAVTYGSLSSFSTSQSAELISQYLSKRGPEGWTTEGISPPAGPSSGVSFAQPYEAFAPDLSAGVLTWTGPALTPDAATNYRNLYLRDSSDGVYRLITVVAPRNGSESRFVGASSNFHHIVFQADDALTETAAVNERNIYEWSSGRLSLVSIPPGATSGAPGAGVGDGTGNVPGAVSSDGSSIFWTDGGQQLYDREGGEKTIKVNSSQRLPSMGDGSARFLGSTPDGSYALFDDETPLTNDVNDHGGLYGFRAVTGQLTDLSPTTGAAPGVFGVLGYGDGGDSVYFVAGAVLASGATAGVPNLYVSRRAGLTFVASLSNNDSSDWSSEATSKTSMVSPDGEHVVFMSDVGLTGYDNQDVLTDKPDSEIFIYDAAEGRLHCVSCNPSGEQPAGPSSVPGWLNTEAPTHYLSNDGNHVFFDSLDALTPRDTNDAEDVYEWERNGPCGRPEGCTYLISSGVDKGRSQFADASPNGENVFFLTAARLVSEDISEDADLYDARVGGGFPATPSPAPCVGEACRGPLSPALVLSGPLTDFGGSADENEGGSSRVRLALKLVGGRGAKGRLRAGKVNVRVYAPGAGRVIVQASAPIGGREELVASTVKRFKRAGGAELALQLAKRARVWLGERRSLRTTIVASFPAGGERRQIHATLRGGGGT